jgi:hypothetical protein
MEIAFGILSAKEPVEAVTQLVDSLGSDDPVFVHHDFSKQPDFALTRGQAHLIPDFMETGWGTPGFVRAVFHLIRTALRRSRFDYFQLLSGSCLPLKPVADLKRHLARQGVPIHADLLDLDADEQVMMSHGHRVFCRAQKPAARLLRRSRRWYLGDNPIAAQRANLGIEHLPDPDASLTTLQWLGRQVHRAARAGLLDDHPFRDGSTPYVGSLWFCLRRDVCEYLVEQEQSSTLLPYLLGLQLCDEIVFPTLLGNSGFAVATSNHHVNAFLGAHPRTFEESDLPALARSDRHFGRKFKPDPADAARHRILQNLAPRRPVRRALTTETAVPA